MEDVEAALRITPLFYDAVLDPRRWQQALAAVSAWIGPSKAATVHFNNQGVLSEGTSPEPHFMMYSYGLSQEAVEDYLSYGQYGPDVDPRTAAYFPRYTNRPMSCRDLVSTETWHSSPTYQDLFKPHDLDFNLAIVIANEALGMILGMALYQGPEGAPYTQRDVSKFQLLVPHLRRASDVYARIVASELKSSQIENAFNDLELATIFTDTAGKILFSNPSADEVFDAGDGLSGSGGYLTHFDPKTSEKLKQAVREVSVSSQFGGDNRVRHLTLPRKTGAPLLATICSLASHDTDRPRYLTSQLRVSIFLTDPAKSYETTAEHLQRVFGLTQTEAEIAKDMASGQTLKEIAGIRERSIETVRQHAKSIMGKTETHRQAELVKKVLSLGIPVAE